MTHDLGTSHGTLVMEPMPRERGASPARRRSASASARPEELAAQEAQERRERAARATDALDETFPEMSARSVITREQKIAGFLTAGVLLVLAIPFPIFAGRIVATVLTFIYAAAVYYRVRCFRLGLRGAYVHRVADQTAEEVADEDLPIYTVLVPAYREPEVIGALLTHLDALVYPRSKLDVIVLLEEDDDVTLPAIESTRLQGYIRVIVVPAGAVTTKPRACNYGLEMARGSLLTIYDAEDEPERLQLVKSALVMAQRPSSVAGLQARLTFSNGGQNIMTKWFTAEYLAWFQYFLPGLSELGSPIPLGGTSNHLRTDALREVGGWDPYNVTEDADLGIRLARRGYKIENLDSVTIEEANSDFINWVKQRSRWLKGYLITWLVHMRHPVKLKREVGWRGFAGINLFVGGTPLLSLINPVVWTTTLLWFAFKPRAIGELFAGPVYILALITWVAGNFAILYMGVVTLRRTGRPELLLSALIVPAYWVMMALAAVKGGIQLVRNPAYWEKTTHGLGQESTTAVVDGSLTASKPVGAINAAATSPMSDAPKESAARVVGPASRRSLSLVPALDPDDGLVGAANAAAIKPAAGPVRTLKLKAVPVKAVPATAAASAVPAKPLPGEAKATTAPTKMAPGAAKVKAVPAKATPARVAPGAAKVTAVPVKATPARVAPGAAKVKAVPVKATPARVAPGAAKVKAVPVKATPARVAPGAAKVKAVPVKATPARVAPGAAKVTAVPAKAAPARVAPGAARVKAVPVKATPARVAPGAARVKAVPVKAAPVKAAPARVAPGAAKVTAAPARVATAKTATPQSASVRAAAQAVSGESATQVVPAAAATKPAPTRSATLREQSALAGPRRSVGRVRVSQSPSGPGPMARRPQAASRATQTSKVATSPLEEQTVPSAPRRSRSETQSAVATLRRPTAAGARSVKAARAKAESAEAVDAVRSPK